MDTIYHVPTGDHITSADRMAPLRRMGICGMIYHGRTGGGYMYLVASRIFHIVHHLRT